MSHPAFRIKPVRPTEVKTCRSQWSVIEILQQLRLRGDGRHKEFHRRGYANYCVGAAFFSSDGGEAT